LRAAFFYALVFFDLIAREITSTYGLEFRLRIDGSWALRAVWGEIE